MKNSNDHKKSQLYYVKTFGCQMNVSDSERIAGFLELHKLKPAKNINEADLVIFNTCGVRQMAEDRVYGQIHNLRLKNKDLRLKIILTGCLAKRPDVIKRLKSKADLFTDIKNFQKNILESKILNLKSSLRCVNDYLNLKPKYSTPFSAYVPIMTGCNNFCSYCIVPYARGREIYRSASKILNEIKKLVKDGYKEIILLGQNVNSYKDGKTNFSKLLKEIDDIKGNFWASFISNHPKDVTAEMIEAVAKCKKVCECFHLPIQAGNDEIIRKMNRKYTARKYLELVEKIKKAFAKHKPSMLYSITSDIIVGFPGETRKQFLDSAEIMKKVGYDMVYFGQYSSRPGTAAWNIKDNISKAEKVRREKYLNEILKKTCFENNQKYIGKNLDVIVDSYKNGFYFGRTRTMKNVKLESKKKNLIGEIIKVKVIKANIWNLEGITIKA
jgi:tRNA-2-methylthio-N6-dimethylallyladenosine synthase